MNITLIGMPGSGKTHVGKILAQNLKFGFLDTDDEMKKEYGLNLPEILQKIGEKQFLEKEKNILISDTSGTNCLVVSPGGSIVYSVTAMEHLKKISTIIYLRTPLPVIENRIGTVPRGIIGAKTKTIAQIFSERSPLYEKWANITVDGNQAAETVTREILSKLKTPL